MVQMIYKLWILDRILASFFQVDRWHKTLYFSNTESCWGWDFSVLDAVQSDCQSLAYVGEIQDQGKKEAMSTLYTWGTEVQSD